MKTLYGIVIGIALVYAIQYNAGWFETKCYEYKTSEHDCKKLTNFYDWIQYPIEKLSGEY